MKKEKLKIQVDISLTVLLVFCMGIQLWPLLAHEVAGTLMLICFGWHTWLNLSYYKGIFKGRYNPIRMAMLVVIVLLWLDILVLLCSSLSISYYIFRYLPSPMGISLGRILHMAASYWAIVLMSVHLGMHWSKFVQLMRLDWHGTLGKGVAVIGFVASFYGLYSFWQLGWWQYLCLSSQFVSFEGIEKAWVFYPICLCIMGGWILIGFYGMKILRRMA